MQRGANKSAGAGYSSALVSSRCFLLLGAVYLSADYWWFGDYDEELKVTEGTDVPADAQVYVPAIIDLPGDPMWINLSRGGSEPKGRTVPRPADLDQAGISAGVEVLSDVMLSSSERFMTTIPSTQEDFAFFQAQRVSLTTRTEHPPTNFDMPLPTDPDAGELDIGTEKLDDTTAGWGETIAAGEAELPDFRKTEIENNTTVAMIVPEAERFETTEDTFIKALTDRSLESVVLEARFTPQEAQIAGKALNDIFKLETLEPGYVVAMRGYRPRRETKTLSLMQVSVYAKDIYVGTLARNSAGVFVSGVDPWVRDDLFNYSGVQDESAHNRQYRLLDAIYSTAARNNVPAAVTGEAIMYLSRGQDLNAFATFNDRLILIYSDTARGQDGVTGRVLYVGVHGANTKLECFVYAQDNGEFACVTGDDRVHSLMAANGMVNPVNGVLTSTFGPRKHPILKAVRIHKGVDWAAPVGTPIVAAFDGEIVFQGDGSGYGNLVRISHPDGRETRYAHMQRFATAGVGTFVKAGDTIGYVGTTGLSTGPHLHFEVYQGGEAIDPLGTVTVIASDDSAVETLTDRIIHVESGGSARAKNPLSSATGLGQFIDQTWIRMMNTYRRDLATTLSRSELLDLRFEPTISREMVRNLAREGEAYLRARGHSISAGRLYLCHFLGMDGAHKVLSASRETMLVDVLGASVIRANPFLTGKDTGYVVSWAERKMRAKGSRNTQPQTSPPTREIRQTSPEFERYKTAIAALVASADATL